MLNQVFLSYRHESFEHVRAVLRLGERLRQAQIPVALDQLTLSFWWTGNSKLRCISFRGPDEKTIKGI
jgi:SEFIR domain